VIIRIDKACAVYWIEKDLLNSEFSNRTVFRNRLIFAFVRQIRLVELNICPGTKRSFHSSNFETGSFILSLVGPRIAAIKSAGGSMSLTEG
jgi:hypothetical protein